MPTFREATMAVHVERERYWRNPKHRAQGLSSLEAYAFPSIGGLAVDKVGGPAIRDLLAPIWNDKPETARRVLQRVKTAQIAGQSGPGHAPDLIAISSTLKHEPHGSYV